MWSSSASEIPWETRSRDLPTCPRQRRKLYLRKSLVLRLARAGHDAVGEREAGGAATLLAHLELTGLARADKEAGRITIGSEENMVGLRVDDRRKVGIDLDASSTPYELGFTEVFEPRLRALHGIHEPVRAVLVKDGAALDRAACDEVTEDENGTPKETRKTLVLEHEPSLAILDQVVLRRAIDPGRELANVGRVINADSLPTDDASDPAILQGDAVAARRRVRQGCT